MPNPYKNNTPAMGLLNATEWTELLTPEKKIEWSNNPIDSEHVIGYSPYALDYINVTNMNKGVGSFYSDGNFYKTKTYKDTKKRDSGKHIYPTTITSDYDANDRRYDANDRRYDANDRRYDANDRRYDANVFSNTAKSLLKNAPLVDSILGYYQAKRDTPNYSDVENAKNFALRPTNVYSYSPTHITGNMKFNPYDYTEQANKIQSQAAAAQNLVARQGRGNTNMLMAHINNLLSNTNRAAGDAYNKAWQANEAQRMAVAQENRRADEYNANADNTAAQSYTQARNLAATQDKTNGYNALNNYATQKYGRQQAYQQRLAAARDEMISNLGTYGENAFNANEANTDQSYNYWKDAFGRLHYNGGKPYDYNLALDNDIWQSVYDNASDDERAKLNSMTRQQRRNYIVDKLYKANA